MLRTSLIIAALFALAACANTARGVQKDLERTGEVIIDATNR